MTNLKKIISNFFGIILFLSSVGHFYNPEFSSGLIPEFFPKTIVHVIIGVIELALAVGVFVPRFRNDALLGIFWLMIMFVPIHILDIFRDEPVLGSVTGAIIRLLVQFLLVYLAWFARNKLAKGTT